VASERDEYARDLIYQIIQCAGCNYISFREICVDLESVPTDEFGNKCRAPETIYCYPKFIKNHKKINDTHYFPATVANVYNEVIHALQEEALLLSSIGLRVAVEAVCSDLGIKGKNLNQKINKLSSEGHISKKDAARLHGIRFMRNDTSQKIVDPGKKDIEIALQIVEHMLSTVYILPKKADDAISKAGSAGSEHDELDKMLAEEMANGNPGNEESLSTLSGNDTNKAHEQYLLWRLSLWRR
jgi:hypothetical protein